VRSTIAPLIFASVDRVELISRSGASAPVLTSTLTSRNARTNEKSGGGTSTTRAPTRMPPNSTTLRKRSGR
jgi:hypothetical protein